MPRVMISYRNNEEQKAFATELNQAFNADVETWIDYEKIASGQFWKDAIIDGIKDSDYVVLCLSTEYLKSSVCMLECYIARGYRKKVLPLWIS